jgi:hypothetical protein
MNCVTFLPWEKQDESSLKSFSDPHSTLAELQEFGEASAFHSSELVFCSSVLGED